MVPHTPKTLALLKLATVLSYGNNCPLMRKPDGTYRVSIWSGAMYLKGAPGTAEGTDLEETLKDALLEHIRVEPSNSIACLAKAFESKND